MWTESFLVLDRDGVFTVDQTDEPTLSGDAPLSHPHWRRVQRHIEECPDDVSDLVERLRSKRQLPGERRGLLARLTRKSVSSGRDRA